MVGHTHEDVDQSFSLLSKYLHKHSAESMEGTNKNLIALTLVRVLIIMVYTFNIS